MPITVHQDDTITGSTLVIEEHVFINCKLKNCRLYYSGGAFEWINTSFENCQWGFRGAARDTVQLLGTIGLLKPGEIPAANAIEATGKTH
jgi:hypothetical protein